MPASLRCAAWIEDFQHKRYPEYFSADERRARDALHQQVARHSRTIIVSSQAAQNDLDRFCPSASRRSQVLSFRSVPSDEWFAGNSEAVAESYRLPPRFFIVCNQFWKHKNHGVVFQALAKLRQKNVYPHVVCTGPVRDHRNPSYPLQVQTTIRELGIESQVSLLGLLPRLEQVQLMRRSVAVVQPSLFEGWSSVVEDARSLGKPIVLSDIPVHREQLPPRAAFFNPLAVEELAEALGDAWHNLEAGPDFGAEGEARMAQGVLVRSFGEQFLQLARTAE
jgi:glycosyltransferase involved in cell wall biosynthesis